MRSNYDVIIEFQWINFICFITALLSDEGKYILNGLATINPYPRNYSYGGVTFEYSGASSPNERVTTPYAIRLKKDLIVEVIY